MDKKFWAVWKSNGGMSSCGHQTKSEAVAEAERLARKERTTFYIMEAVGMVELKEQPIKYTDI